MSTVPLKSVGMHTWDVPRAELGHSASVMFVAFVAILATFVFTMPVTESWKHSTYENYDNTIDDAEASVREGTLSRQIALGGFALIGVAALAWPGGKTLRVHNVLGAICVCYLAWCLATCLWSDDFSMSLRRWIALMCEVAAGVAIAKRTSARQFVWFVFTCTLAWLGLGVLAELSLGTFRPLEEGHRFAGVFHPNVMGVNAALLTLASLYLAIAAGRRNWLLISVAALSFVFLLLTRSRTSLAAMLVAIAVFWIFTAPASRKFFHTLLAGIAAACLTMAVGLGMFDISANLITMGRADNEMSTFTGRVPLWQELLQEFVPQRPLVGHGYGAFWTADHIAEVSRSQDWVTTHAHSSYIDLVLNVGYIGAALCATAMLLAAIAGLRREVRRAGAGYGFIAMIVVFGLTAGLTETYIGLTWFLSFFGICGVCYLLFDGNGKSIQPSPSSESPRPNRYPPRHRRKAIV